MCNYQVILVNSNVVKGNIMLLKLVSCDTSVVEMQSVGFHNGNVIQPIQFHHQPSPKHDKRLMCMAVHVQGSHGNAFIHFLSQWCYIPQL